MKHIGCIAMFIVGFSEGIRYARKNPDEEFLRRVEKLLLPIMAIIAAVMLGDFIAQLL